MAGKYSGAYVPGAGVDDEPPVPKRTLQEKYGGNAEWRQQRGEDKARLRAWMNGREPVEWWEYYPNATPPQQYLCMEFPTTVHYFVVAFERAPEYGKLYTWCFGCKCDDCGACAWARQAYALALRESFRAARVDLSDVPF
jgi:hypothetical protein